MLEINGSVLAKFSFSLCRVCVVEYWRTTDMQQEMEDFIEKQIEIVKANMKKHIYLRKKHLT